MNKRWAIREADAEASRGFVQSLGIPKPLADVLSSRGIRKAEDALAFLQPSITLLHSPFLMKDMENAVVRFKKAIELKETIAVFADSDLDGLTSLAALMTLIQRISPGAHVHFRYPRGNEYYGLTKDVIDEFHEKNVTFLITLDCGTKDVAEIAYAAEKGIDALVIDHHEAEGELPRSLVVNPKRKDCKYPFKELAGVGVVFKFCHAVLMSYVPAFSKKFLIVTQSRSHFEMALILNGVVLWSGSCANEKDISNRANDADYLMGYHCGDILRKNTLKHVDIEEELKSLSNVNQNLSSGQDYHRIKGNSIDAAVCAFRELQYRKSPRIIEFNNSILGLVALGSIADIVPLVNENRILVRMGLEALKSTPHEGLSLLLNNKKVTSKTLGWHVAPILNAPGRMGKTDCTAEFLLGADGRGHREILEEILGLNTKRREMVDNEFARISELIENGNIDTSSEIVFVKADLPEGVIGLIANRVSDVLKKPVIVVSRPDENGVVKGSGRVRGDYDFFSKISDLAPLFGKIGGHAQAFGFTINEILLDEAVKKISQAVSDSNYQSPLDSIDCVLDIHDITIEAAESMELLEPTGKGNEEPVFLTRNMVIKKFLRIGADGRHGKYLFRDNCEAEAVGWNMGDLMEQYASAQALNLVYRLEAVSFNGRRYPQMVILDIFPK